jgi:DNA processing protein
MLEQKTLDWLRLALIPEIGPVRGRKLLEKFKQPRRILLAPTEEIAPVVGESVAQRIQQRKEIKLNEQLRLIEEYQVKIITLDDPEYPANLKNIFDPPLVLFLRGQILPEDDYSIAIVGTRMATVYGVSMARKISSQLGQLGFTIISGGARGIDTAAHQSALRINARTVVVLGCGVDVVYPEENSRLFEEVAHKGALVSEFPMKTPPLRQNFPRRNRVISGLSVGVVVVEAPRRSGALITVSSALEQGREVFCVPGQADNFNMKGSHQLLKEGAKLVEDVDDIIEEIRPLLRNRLPDMLKDGQQKPQPELTPQESRICGLLGSEPKSLQEITEQSGISVGSVIATLTQLEIKGLIIELPGKFFLSSAKRRFVAKGAGRLDGRVSLK